MSNETEFVNGLIAKAPNDGAPEYVKAKLSIKREELIEWLQSKDGEWINAEVKVSRNDNWYIAVDNWKPEGGRREAAPQREKPAKEAPARNEFDADFADDDIPF